MLTGSRENEFLSTSTTLDCQSVDPSSVYLMNDLKTKLNLMRHHKPTCHKAMSGDTREEEAQSQPAGRQSLMRQRAA